MSRIFDIELPEITKEEELQKIIAANSHLDPGFISTSAVMMSRKRKKMIEQMWSEFEPYADPGFSEKIKLNGEFLSRCWEMTVACALLRLNHSLQQKTSDIGPDVKIITSSPTVWVEAVISTRGTGPDALPELLYGVAQTLPKNEMVLRFGNAITTKHRKYQTHLNSGLIKPNEPFIIAVSKGSINYPDAYPPTALRYLYGIGDLTLHMPIDQATGERKVVNEFFSRQLPIPKKQGKEVPVAFFEDPANACISAVLYCDNHILNHPELLGSDFILFRNPNTSAPLPENFFPIGAEWVPKDGLVSYIDKKFIRQADAFDYLDD